MVLPTMASAATLQELPPDSPVKVNEVDDRDSAPFDVKAQLGTDVEADDNDNYNVIPGEKFNYNLKVTPQQAIDEERELQRWLTVDVCQDPNAPFDAELSADNFGADAKPTSVQKDGDNCWKATFGTPYSEKLEPNNPKAVAHYNEHHDAKLEVVGTRFTVPSEITATIPATVSSNATAGTVAKGKAEAKQGRVAYAYVQQGSKEVTWLNTNSAVNGVKLSSWLFEDSFTIPDGAYGAALTDWTFFTSAPRLKDGSLADESPLRYDMGTVQEKRVFKITRERDEVPTDVTSRIVTNRNGTTGSKKIEIQNEAAPREYRLASYKAPAPFFLKPGDKLTFKFVVISGHAKPVFDSDITLTRPVEETSASASAAVTVNEVIPGLPISPVPVVKDEQVVPEVIHKGDQVDLTDNITGLPEGAKVEDVTPKGVVDVNKPGEYTGKVKVTFPDGSSRVVEVPVTVKDRVQAGTITPVPVVKDEQVVPEVIHKGDQVDLTDNVTGLPEGAKVEDITPEGVVDVNKPGEYTGKVKVTFPDGSSRVVEVPVTVKDRVQAGTITPVPVVKDEQVVPEVIHKGDQVDLTDNVTGLPEGAKVEDVTPKGVVDVNKPGEYTGKVKVTFPDGSSRVVEVPVTVKDRVQAGTITPVPVVKDEQVVPEVIHKGDQVDLTDNVTGLPEGAKVEDITPEGVVDVNKPGEYTGKVKVTFPDGSSRVVEVPVTVKEQSESTPGEPAPKPDKPTPAPVPDKPTSNQDKPGTTTVKDQPGKKTKLSRTGVEITIPAALAGITILVGTGAALTARRRRR
ncbi:Rib/alpha-like domain-containing protein [Gleimia hominis]|uniref:Rib/alpha-like domain-containing protein n=1 Tax=Gleimia hominis TaxID=595468 RepID=A0ABU3IFN9_9ACTO|nr:Rib/alpha-like domain-containing protein [Gleimia hominis]MDT3768050.1 Rib/alpha-like domain-containing protein [Gleimia hominis]